MANYIKLGSNKWQIRWTDHQLGKRPSKTIIGTKKDAEKEVLYYSRKEYELKNGFITKRVNMLATISHLTEWYINKGLVWKNAHREVPLDKKTVYIHNKALRQFANVFGENCLISSISSIKYREHYADRKLNGLNVDIRAMITIINTAMSHSDKIVSEMPTELFQFSVKHGTPFYLEYDEVNKIMSLDMDSYYKSKPWDFDSGETMRIFMLYMLTGCRLHELLSLEWDRVDFVEKSIVVIGKRKKLRKLFITDTAIQILMSLTDREKPMPYTASKVRDRLKDINCLSGIKFTTHNLRSTCGSFMLSAGCSIEEVSEHLGHEDIQTTRRWYARIIEHKRKDATRKMEKLTHSMSSSTSPDRNIILN